jgi:hypothetical protein
VRVNIVKKVDKQVSLPEHRFTTLFHPKLTSDQMKALQSRVRDKEQEGGKVMSSMTDFDAETEDESKSKKKNREESKRSDFKETMNEIYQTETEDESTTLKAKDDKNIITDNMDESDKSGNEDKSITMGKKKDKNSRTDNMEYINQSEDKQEMVESSAETNDTMKSIETPEDKNIEIT